MSRWLFDQHFLMIYNDFQIFMKYLWLLDLSTHWLRCGNVFILIFIYLKFLLNFFLRCIICIHDITFIVKSSFDWFRRINSVSMIKSSQRPCVISNSETDWFIALLLLINISTVFHLKSDLAFSINLNFQGTRVVWYH